jgi:hypothetical protein
VEQREVKQMKKLLSSVNMAEVGLLKSLLEADGIPCATRNEQLSIASGGVPFVDCYPELWVLNDEDYATAQERLARWHNTQAQRRAEGSEERADWSTSVAALGWLAVSCFEFDPLSRCLAP